jgi:DNA ligase D-like protein (predicted 3'-phosphoesterase)
MSDDPRLDKYLAKRDFTLTAEPTGGGPTGGLPRFVVQKHAARRLHYDVRLEVEGVLVSWAVPQGPSYDPSVKRLAVMTEDHPMDYAGFEGTIPKGQYGGGAVVVWDAGVYHNLTADKQGNVRPMREAIERGHVKVWFEGEKLVGTWAFTRIEDRQWLLVKVKDATADPEVDPVRDAPGSILTGRTIEEVAKADGPVWHSNRS